MQIKAMHGFDFSIVYNHIESEISSKLKSEDRTHGLDLKTYTDTKNVEETMILQKKRCTIDHNNDDHISKDWKDYSNKWNLFS